MILILCRNLLECVPDWACEAKKLEILDISHNLLTEVPMRYVYTCVHDICV
jgi:PH domain/leucine-rich repeat-containing protein phosphatase